MRNWSLSMSEESGWNRTGSDIPLGPSGAIVAADWALERLSELGVSVPPDNRLMRAKRLLTDVNNEKIPLSPEDDELLFRVAEAQWTILEQYIIARATRTPSGTITDTHRRKLEMILSGRDTPDETNSIARDTQFELYIASLFAMAGIPVRIGEPDLLIFLGEEEVGIAAKRVKTTKQIHKRVKHAIEQIRRSARRGIIAVNADLLLKDTGLADSVAERGRAFDERLRMVHRLDDRLVGEEEVAGRVVIGRTSIWRFNEGRPELEMPMFRQYRFFANSDEEEEKWSEFVVELERRISSRMQNL